jgi:hypothetical protein
VPVADGVLLGTVVALGMGVAVCVVVGWKVDVIVGTGVCITVGSSEGATEDTEYWTTSLGRWFELAESEAW